MARLHHRHTIGRSAGRRNRRAEAERHQARDDEHSAQCGDGADRTHRRLSHNIHLRGNNQTSAGGAQIRDGSFCRAFAIRQGDEGRSAASPVARSSRKVLRPSRSFGAIYFEMRNRQGSSACCRGRAYPLRLQRGDALVRGSTSRMDMDASRTGDQFHDLQSHRARDRLGESARELLGLEHAQQTRARSRLSDETHGERSSPQAKSGLLRGLALAPSITVRNHAMTQGGRESDRSFSLLKPPAGPRPLRRRTDSP